ncbi:hypothetical protein SD81_018745 [Tolypothrix campylonemoides VB511288]|nr:hypothetical protein SD81_018745 [Tolypothrix campylonemoides VB511288]
MINKLAKVISAAAVLTMAASFAPESALAQKFSGGANNTSDTLEFDLNTSAPYTGDTFSGAIQNAIYKVGEGSDVGSSGDVVYFKPADLTIETVSGAGLNNRQSNFQGQFGTTAVKYKATLEENSDPKRFISFEFFAPDIEPFTNRTSLSIFNASNLTPFLNPQGQVRFPENISSLTSNPLNLSLSSSSGFVLTPGSDNVTKVPDPATTASLLGFGIVSTALLRKRNKRLETSLSKS